LNQQDDDVIPKGEMYVSNYRSLNWPNISIHCHNTIIAFGFINNSQWYNFST